MAFLLRLRQLRQILVDERVEGQAEAIENVFGRFANLFRQVGILFLQRPIFQNVAEVEMRRTLLDLIGGGIHIQTPKPTRLEANVTHF